MAWSEKTKLLLKTYCRIDELDAESEALLESLYHSSVDYLLRSGISEPIESDPGRLASFNLCVCYLVLDAWDLRAMTITGTIESDNPAFQRMINQLKLTEPVSESDTE